MPVPSPLAPSRSIDFPAVDGFLTWHNVTPHLGAVYDVFGNGKTALKISLNKYLEVLSAGAGMFQDPNPLTNLITQTTRSWTDTNRNYVADCNLLMPAANGECGAMANPNFGVPVQGATFDPRLMHGWNKQAFNWEFSTGIQHEILPRTSVDVSYFRRSYGNFRVTDNRNLSPSDFDKFDVIAPSDPRLPGGGGYKVQGMYNLNPAKFGIASDNLVTLARYYGQQTEYWHGADVNVAMRFVPGLLLQGGTSTGRTVTDNCDLLSKVPEPGESRATSGLITFGTPRPLQFCHNATIWLTQVKLLSSYTIPRIDVMVSGTLQNLPGAPIQANYTCLSATAAQTLGRPLSGAQPTCGAAARQRRLLRRSSEPGGLPRRQGPSVRADEGDVSVDFYNMLNASTALVLNNTFGPAGSSRTAFSLPGSPR
jgi:hypothetical protein